MTDTELVCFQPGETMVIPIQAIHILFIQATGSLFMFIITILHDRKSVKILKKPQAFVTFLVEYYNKMYFIIILN